MYDPLWHQAGQAPLVHGISPGKNTGVGCHFLLQGIFPTQGWNLCLLHCRQILYHWATREALRRNVYLRDKREKLNTSLIKLLGNYWVVQEERRTGKKRTEIKRAIKKEEVGISGEPADPKLRAQIIMTCKGIYRTLYLRVSKGLVSVLKRPSVSGGGINLPLESIHENTKAQILELGVF